MNYLELAKKFVKKSRFGSIVAGVFPRSWLYTGAYTEVRRLHSMDTAGDTDKVDSILRQKMTHLLQETLQHVPWYRNNVQVDPESITIDNVYDKLREFPYLEKKTITDNWNDFINDRYPLSKLKIGSTEGTTGQGMKIASSRREIGAEVAFARCHFKTIDYDSIRTRTIRIGLEALKKQDEDPYTLTGNRLLVSPVHLNGKWFADIYKKCRDYNAEVIHSYPTLLFLFSQYINEQHLAPLKVKALFLSSDVFLFTHYESFMKAFERPEIVSYYNMCEHVVAGFSVLNIETKSIGYQLDRIYSYNENLIDEFGRCEIIGTSYWNEAMPFIRYCTKDYGRIDENGFIASLDGRETTYLTTKQGDKIAGISMLEPEDYWWDYINAYQLVHTKPGDLIVRIVPKDNFNEDIKVKIIQDLEKNWPGLFDYHVETANELERGRSTKVQTIIVKFKEEI